MSEHLDKIKEAVISGKHTEIEALVEGAIEDKADLDQIINDGMIAAMDVVGQRFAESEIFIPEMLVSAVTMKKGLDIIKPLLKGDKIESKGTIIMCTVKGDIHGNQTFGSVFYGEQLDCLGFFTKRFYNLLSD